MINGNLVSGTSLYQRGREDRVPGTDGQPPPEGLHDLDPLPTGPHEGPQHPPSVRSDHPLPLTHSLICVNICDLFNKEDVEQFLIHNALWVMICAK